MAYKPKMGMYDETPKITIGKFTICEHADPPDKWVWIEETGEDGGGFLKSAIEPVLKAFYDKHF